MIRFLIFTFIFPPLALLVFNVPDMVLGRLSALDLLWWVMGVSYIAVIIPAWLMAGVDWAFSEKPKYTRMLRATMAGALIADAIVYFLWGGFRELWPVVMAALVGAVPSAICAWLVPTRKGLA